MRHFHFLSYMLTKDGQIHDTGSFVYHTTANGNLIDDAKHYIRGYIAGPPEGYSAIVILNIQPLTKEQAITIDARIAQLSD